MKLHAVFATLILPAVPHALPAQDDVIIARPATNLREPLPNGSVSGRVLLADTRSPARGARVFLLPLADATGKHSNSQQSPGTGTALDGSYVMTHVAPGEYAVVAIAAGYLSPLDGMKIDPQAKGDTPEMDALLRKSGAVVKVSGSSSARADLELARGAIFSGRVIYTDGQPAVSARLTLEKVEDGQETEGKRVDAGSLIRLMTQQPMPQTDDQGNFRIAGVSPGKYRLAVVQSSSTASLMEEMMAAMGQKTKAVTSLTVYSGNTLHRKAATAYDVGPGDVRDGLQVMLPLNGLHQVTGTVSSKTGLTLDSATISLTDTTDKAIQFSTRAFVAGEFVFAGVPEGTYELKVANARIYENPPPMEWPEEQMEEMQGMFKPTHAFADATQAVIVKDADLTGVAISLIETALPKPGADGIGRGIGVVAPAPPPPPPPN